jgi:hypothetical protein
MAKLMMPSVYDALKSAGADEAKAREAAIDVAGYDDRLIRVESKLGTLQWMIGINIAATVAVLVQALL